MRSTARSAGLVLLGLLLALTGHLDHARAQPATAEVGTAFTYQGRLQDLGGPVGGFCDFRFALYDARTGGNQIGDTLTNLDTRLNSGYFSIPEVDFGPGAFPGGARWLKIAVRCPSRTGSWVTLDPRQQLMPAPYALFALEGPFWSLEGNAATDAGTDRLGTTDAVTLTLAVSDTAALRIAPATDPVLGFSPNLVGGWSGNEVLSGVVGATVGGGGAADDGSGTAAPNQVLAHLGTVSGGAGNTAGGLASTVPGGESNSASGAYSLAAGRRAVGLSPGCFVWGDSTDADVPCDADDRWVARASGGVYFYTSGDLSSGAYLDPGGGAWNSLSDREVKQNVQPVEPRQVLARVAELPISTWNYASQSSEVQHMGPMAQDLYEAFRLGSSDRFINSVDADGLALAAIQGLYQIVEEREAQIASLEARLSALEGRGGRAPQALPWLAGLLVAPSLVALGAVWLRRRGDRR